ncbi:MAG: sterol desaturase family protein [Bacteroidia bacterium]|nr:sterol desaturase family protein [Bacteroidia bacterium]NNJ55208.1 carotene hydroxylase [Bacteroidia bacterium]
MLVYFAITLGTFLAMEFVAWFAHKYIMHGLLWNLHKDHHQQEPGFFEKNDFFFLIFAIPSASSFIIGSAIEGWFPLFFVGVGIALYGIAYFFVHDIFIHQRFKLFKRTNNRYLKAIRKAHKVHHKHLGPEDGECFGMLVVPPKFIKEAK